MVLINFMIKTSESFLENIKNRIVASLFSKEAGVLKILIDQVTDSAKNPELGETDEKYLLADYLHLIFLIMIL